MYLISILHISLLTALALSAAGRDLFVFNAIGDDTADALLAAKNIIDAALQIRNLDTLYWDGAGVASVMHAPNEVCLLLLADNDKMVRHNIVNVLKLQLECHNVTRIVDTRIGSAKKATEHVSEILHSLHKAIALQNASLRHEIDGVHPHGHSSATRSRSRLGVGRPAGRRNTPNPNPNPAADRILMLSYSPTTGVYPTKRFMKQWNGRLLAPSAKREGQAAADIWLLGRTKRLSSVSDWRDLQLLCFHLPNSPEGGGVAHSLALMGEYVETLSSVYMSYAARNAYNMLEPRPAIIEANVRLNGRLRFGYWDSLMLETRAHLPTRRDRGISSEPVHMSDLVSPKPVPFLRLVCHTPGNEHHEKIKRRPKKRFGDPAEDTDYALCMRSGGEVDADVDYRNHHTLKAHTETLKEMLTLEEGDFDNRLPWGTDNGALRFRLGHAIVGRNGNNNSTRYRPGHYCYEHSRTRKDKNSERPPSSRIYDRYDKFRPFYSSGSGGGRGTETKVEGETIGGGKGKILVLSGSDAASLPRMLHMHLHKQYYARRHGYRFQLQLSNQFVQYFPRALWSSYEDARTGVREGKYKELGNYYFKGVMSKVLFCLDAMYQHYGSAEWVFFTDSDVHINAEWLHMPLETFLVDVPADKVFVHGNYRSMMTGAFFVRNNEKGRQLVRDWLAIVMSGFVTCHAYDQAALQILMLLRQFPDQPYRLNLGNFSALHKEFQGYQNYKAAMDQESFEQLPPEQQKDILMNRFHGCDMDSDFSADYKFEATLMKLGFTGDFDGYFGDLYSSYSMGCVNAFVRDFHVIKESARRPRLQCFHCAKRSELASVVWDGHLGGGNDRVTAGSVDGYFTNHKVMFLFHEQYLEPQSCKEIKFLGACRVSSGDEGGGVSGFHTPNSQRVVAGASGSGHGAAAGHGVGVAGAGTGDVADEGPTDSVLFTFAVSEENYDQQLRQYRARYPHANVSLFTPDREDGSWSPTVPSPTLLSLHDGYGFDLLTGQFCQVDTPMKALQAHITVMSEYRAAVKAGLYSYSNESWQRLYAHNASFGETKSTKCNEEQVQNNNCPADGLPTRKKDDNWFLYPEDVCSLRRGDNRGSSAHGGWCRVVDHKARPDSGIFGAYQSVECLKHSEGWY